VTVAKLKVTAVIRAYNEERHIGRLLSGLERQTQKPDEVIVVDSGSTDATVDIATHYGARIVTIDKAKFSFGRSLNLGCDAAKGDLLLNVSAHVYPVYDTFVQHITAPFSDDKVGITYGRQIGDHRTKYSESRVLLKWFPTTNIPVQDHPFSNNANAVVRKSLWEKYQYDEELTGLEDLDFAKRAMNDGWKISYVADAPVVHVHEETWDRIRNRYRREAIAYARIMGQKEISAVEAVGLAAANTLSDYVHAAREGVLIGENLLGVPAFRAAQFLGAWEGYRQQGRITEGLKRRFYYPLSPAEPPIAEAPGQPIDYSDHPDPVAD
jgi:glycosyltransferase involved in cell wall biosynthesis